MISARVVSAAAATLLLSVASAATSTVSSKVAQYSLPPDPDVKVSELIDIGCFDDPTPLQDRGPYEFQSPGNCQRICGSLDMPVFGLVDGTNCWCGDKKPAKSAQIANKTCDTLCGGAGPELDKCGGPGVYWIGLSGITKNRIDWYEPAESSSSASRSSTKTEASSTAAAETSAAASSSAPADEKKSGPNKAGIAAGVVVGVVVLAAVIAGVVLYLRRKKRLEIEEEYRRRNAVNSFVGGKLHTSNSSMTDSRLDPEFMNRRQSNGSIADNEDYSRRILKVTNA